MIKIEFIIFLLKISSGKKNSTLIIEGVIISKNCNSLRNGFILKSHALFVQLRNNDFPSLKGTLLFLQIRAVISP